MVLTEMLPRGFTVRPSREGDIAALTELASACEIELYGNSEVTLEDMRHFWHMPGFKPESDSWVILEPQGKLVAMVMVDHQEHARIYQDGDVHPEYRGRGLGTYLMHVAEERARQHIALAAPDVRVVLATGKSNLNTGAHELFREHGFQLLRHFWRMQIDMQEAPVAPQWAEGITVRSMAPGEERKVYEADEEAFKDHWGHMQHDYEEWLHWTVKRDGFDPSLWFLAMDGEEIAGVSLCSVEKGSGAWVQSLGVRRLWRRKGIALALLQHSFAEFYKRGMHTVLPTVDSQSLTGATRLYERAGMHVTRQYDRYEKELRPGRELSTQTVEG